MDGFGRGIRDALPRASTGQPQPGPHGRWECAQLMPADIRPEVETSAVSRKDLTDLRRALKEHLDGLEWVWEKNN